MESNDLPDVLEALGALFDLLIRSYGPWGTVLVISLIGLAGFAWRVYNDRRRDKEIEMLIAEKDRTIQRLADTERMYRALFLHRETDWTQDQIDRFVMQNDFADAIEARRALEQSSDEDSADGE